MWKAMLLAIKTYRVERVKQRMVRVAAECFTEKHCGGITKCTAHLRKLQILERRRQELELK